MKQIRFQKGNFTFRFVIPSHIGISGNEKADIAAKEAASEQTLPTNNTLYFKDLLKLVNDTLIFQWKLHWNNTASPHIRIAPTIHSNKTNTRNPSSRNFKIKDWPHQDHSFIHTQQNSKTNMPTMQLHPDTATANPRLPKIHHHSSQT